MTNFIITYQYYYRYREARKQVKNLVDSADYSGAKIKLDSAIAEHETKYGTTQSMKLNRPDFNYGERIAMEHPARHLDAVITQNDPSFVEADGVTLGHHSDIVKQGLLHVPKTDYSEVPD